MQKSIRILGALILIALGIWGWRTFFPGAERVIRGRLVELSQALAFSPTEGSLDKLANSRRVASFFAEDVEVVADIPGYGQQRFEGSERIFQAMMAARQQLSGLTVEFLDITVTVQSDGTATATFTAKAAVPGQPDFMVQEFQLQLRKIDGEWLIVRVETVKTLSQLDCHPCAISADA